MIDGQALAEAFVAVTSAGLRLTIPSTLQASGPVWLDDDGRLSNAVWWNPMGAQVVAIKQERVETIAPGLVTALDLLSLLLHEDEGEAQARRIAQRHDLKIVGAIAALGLYQFRLPASTYLSRDEWIARLRQDPSVEHVLVEDDNSLLPDDPAPQVELADRRGWEANRFTAAVELYQRRLADPATPHGPRVRIGIVESGVNFRSRDFARFAQPCRGTAGVCIYAAQSGVSSQHGSIVTGILASALYPGGNLALLSRLAKVGNGFELRVDLQTGSGVTARVASSVNLVEAGAQVLNWSWGVHRLGARDRSGEPVQANVRSALALDGYEALLGRFFVWLEREHPGVIVINSSGNSGSDTEDHLPSGLYARQLLVVGAHQRNRWAGPLSDARAVRWRDNSNRGQRLDIVAAACPHASASTAPKVGRGGGCGTSYAAALVTGTVAAMLSVDPHLKPEQVRRLLREGALPFAALPGPGTQAWTPCGPQPGCSRVRRSERVEWLRLDMHRALDLALDPASTGAPGGRMRAEPAP
ncbi:S8 family serine peptidase [Pseudomonas sp. S75]|uniref:S8 family serine peptidase n=1 Tax=unclassified Pseudomonas TaxID=196821 RepID=UPI0019056353|nr:MULTISPECIES: S8 family serine peptidase [unclassified Pseudomonas]MBJ9973839.1 S8 family serine peptidase [Pseudomonas sp. S30]MBK0152231.1 S8 family serine peptidase [Pseudomonas sp. S75]